MNLGEKITSLRKKSGMTQEDLANELNVSRQTISKWELSQSNPELIHIAKLSDIFDVTTDYLIKDTETTNQKTTENSPSNSEITYINTIINTPPKITPQQLAGLVLSFCSGFLTIISGILCQENIDWEIGIVFGFILFVIGLELLLIKNSVMLKITWTIWFLFGFRFLPKIYYYFSHPYLLNTINGIFTLLTVIILIILIIITIFYLKLAKRD